ncbi:MAG: HAMP domain-containing histidine kinase [Kofleriaceae bacterium]|nr:HAMP domain-containing histidine kinase [Kofleriaceae bacterium]
MRFPPANIQLRRAQLSLILAVLVPTILMIVAGIILLATTKSSTTLALGVLILAGCATGLTGYILGSIFVGKGASLARVQNDFVSSVSHELRTPITSIRLLIEALGADRLPADEKAKVLSLLAQETSRLETLVTRVLELSKLETGGHMFARDPVNIAALVHESISAFDALTLSNPVAVQTDVDDTLIIDGDRSTLVRALVNLLVNAWKYSGDDKKISVHAHAAGRWVEICVRDNGIGLDRLEKREIFEQFVRGKAALAGGAPGVGLGLSFVRVIVRAHRGKIDTRAVPGGGTEFRLRLRYPRRLRRSHSKSATLSAGGKT